MRRETGFTLIELMIVIAIIAIIAAIAIPNLLSARLNANETSAVATLRNISSAQAQFQTSAKADVDNDGTGEFGVFRELAGGSDVRTDATGGYSGTAGSGVLSPPALSGSFRNVSLLGEVTRSGYQFRMFLPVAFGFAVTETNLPNVFLSPVDTDLAETTWATYAWPSNYGNSGNRTFFVNQTGDITSTDTSAYAGPDAIDEDSAGSAFIGPGSTTSITGRVAVGTTGREHNAMWRQVN